MRGVGGKKWGGGEGTNIKPCKQSGYRNKSNLFITFIKNDKINELECWNVMLISQV